MRCSRDGNVEISRDTYQKTLFPAPAAKPKNKTKTDLVSAKPQSWGLTDVSHGPIEVSPEFRTFSILKKCFPE
jgi:hypothetical protein